MYLHELKLWNFRKYGTVGENFDSSEAGLVVHFNEGVNVLVGENDSGKTTIIDAIRYILRTQSLEYIQIDEKDFHQDPLGNRANELRIECTFKGFSDCEAGHFLEWLGFETNPKGKNEYLLKIWLYARNKDNSIYQYVRAGIDAEGSYIEGEARDLLRVVYLKPLRDALSEMTHGNKSRLAQILKSHSIFKKINEIDGSEKKHELEKHYIDLKKGVDGYFDANQNETGKQIVKSINDILIEDFLLSNEDRNAVIKLTGSELSDILRQLDLVLEDNKSGLGSLNLLCIAAELLLFNENKPGLKLTLIEELEAHLHPQYQLRLIDFINRKKIYGQFILTTHSTTLASKIKLENLIVCNEKNVYPMGHNYTQLVPSDYKFLERFLDATKANLFFAKGVLIVEGDAENLLVSTIAELLDRPLHKYGVSIVNVGSTAFKRYAKIFLRKQSPEFSIKVSIISDLDERSIEYYEDGKSKEITVVDSVFTLKMKAITNELEYQHLPGFFTSESDFKEFVKNNKTVVRFQNQTGNGKSIMDQLIETFNTIEQQDISSNIISEIRKNKKNNIENEWSQCTNVNIYISKQWTLEYEIACSKLSKYLIQAIQIAKREKINPDSLIDDDLFMEVKKEVETEFQEENLTPQVIYEIFKPLCLGSISKASTAQYLANILEIANNAGEDVKERLLSDSYLKYLRDAIYHVTKPPNNSING